MRIASKTLPILLSFLSFFAACKKANTAGSLKFTESCESDSQCASGHCLEAGEQRFCSQECGADSECAAKDTLYCCESLGQKNYCVRPLDQCRQPILADACSGPDDPYCARGNMECLQVGGRLACTFECISDDDCVTTTLTQCQAVDGRKLCVPVDPDSLPRKQSDCLGDRDCPAGQVCQIDFDNRLDPRALITACSSDQLYGPQKAYTGCTADRTQCDRFFCIDNFCPATCGNDSHCIPGFECRPQPIATGGDSIAVVGLCAKIHGSEIPCDKQTPVAGTGAVCPSGEACGYKQRFDGALDTVCLSHPKAEPTMQPVSSTFARLDEACSPLEDDDNNPTTADKYKLVGGEVKLCADDLCLSDIGYCSAPCLEDADCPAVGSTALSCVHFDFQPHCERPERVGAANGQACSGGNGSFSCASFFCNGSTCAARKAAGDACTQSNECLSFECVNNTCKKLCRDDATCGNGRVCEADIRLADVFGTQSTIDDLIDTPTFCTDVAGAIGVGCPSPSGCAGPQVCHTFTSGNGGLRGVCADPVTNGAAAGAACTQDAACASRYCLILGAATSGVCSALCADDSTCAAGTRCLPVTNLGTTVDTVCGKSPGTAADGAACTRASDCASFVCAENTCRTLCPTGTAAGSGCTSGTCAAVAIGVDARYTSELFDDRYDTLLVCVDGALPFTGDPAACAAPRQFVFREIGGTLQGACLTPIADAKAQGAQCRSATECKTGLCVDNKCSVACTLTPANSCNVGTCDLSAPALLGESPTLTVPIAACR